MADLVSLFAQIKPAVVAILKRHGNGPLDHQVVGTGFNVDPKGVVVTCGHVIKGVLADSPFVSTGPGVARAKGDISFLQVALVLPEADGRTIRMERRRIVMAYGLDEYDVAICRLEPAAFPFPSLRLGDGGKVTEGTPIGVCGYPLRMALEENPHHLASIFQSGIIGSVAPYPATRPDQRTQYVLDMGVNPGNSGGPVFLQEDGSVVGIVRAIRVSTDEVLDENGQPLLDEEGQPAKLKYRVPTGLSYAVPIDLVLTEIEKVRRLTDEEVKAVNLGRKPAWWDSGLAK